VLQDPDHLPAQGQDKRQGDIAGGARLEFPVVVQADGQAIAQVPDPDPAVGQPVDLEVPARNGVFLAPGDDQAARAGFRLPFGIRFALAFALTAQLHRVVELSGINQLLVFKDFDLQGFFHENLIDRIGGPHQVDQMATCRHGLQYFLYSMDANFARSVVQVRGCFPILPALTRLQCGRACEQIRNSSCTRTPTSV
jgi:hypothetical protein